MLGYKREGYKWLNVGNCEVLTLRTWGELWFLLYRKNGRIRKKATKEIKSYLLGEYPNIKGLK